MMAFEVYINGKKKCRAGIRGPCVLTASLCWVLREPTNPCGKRKELSFGVGGLGGRNDVYLQWYQKHVKPGDEVTIRVVEAAKVDKPKKKRIFRATPAQIKERKQAAVRRMAKEFGWKIQTE